MRSYNACIKVTLQSTQCALPVYLFHTQYLRPADTYASEHVLRPDVSDARKSVDVNVSGCGSRSHCSVARQSSELSAALRVHGFACGLIAYATKRLYLISLRIESHFKHFRSVVQTDHIITHRRPRDSFPFGVFLLHVERRAAQFFRFRVECCCGSASCLRGRR